jgi:hypothetical protein
VEVSVQELQNQYGSYLMPHENIQMGFKLIRDSRVASIHLNSIYEVIMETVGTGFDDSELTIHFITSPFYKTNNVQTSSKR